MSYPAASPAPRLPAWAEANVAPSCARAGAGGMAAAKRRVAQAARTAMVRFGIQDPILLAAKILYPDRRVCRHHPNGWGRVEMTRRAPIRPRPRGTQYRPGSGKCFT